ncbi:hypothetical protein BKA64DRAFT_739380 [Cadophora sp. MPI-SDFR-AT-0126]|nr:hypothetical protein BKA64DRAFT_739380 [Leotiomycetes sp. MPI-SDFR-AT-0126]
MRFFTSQPVVLSTLLLATLSSTTPLQLAPRECYAGEGTAQLCYRDPVGTPQNVEVSDIQAVATYLREYGRRSPRNPTFWTMLIADTPNCAEWSVYSQGSVLITAKHIDNTKNTSVLFADIANTIDGGEFPTEASKAAALIGCGTDGGSLGTLINSTNTAYNTTVYRNSGYSPSGILIKLVANIPA